MTTTITTHTPAIAQVEHIDPTQVVLEENIRQQAVVLDDEFLDSVRSNGVVTPVSGRRADDGTVYIRYGQRRVLAAREVGLTTIPVYMNATDATVAERVVGQLVENERRAEMTETERVDAYRVLELEGLSVAKIAKATGTRKDRVQASVTVAASEVARAALDEVVSLDMALALVEFEDDPEACSTILQYNDDELPWVTQKLRNERIISAAWEHTAEELREAGFTVMERNDYDYTNLHQLTDARPEEEDRPGLDADQHTGCPGNAIIISVSVRDGEPSTDQRAVCIRPELHHSRWGHRNAKVDVSSLPEEEQEAAREQRRAERRRLIENNKNWDAATKVRIDWLVEFLTRKQLPKDAGEFLAITLTRHASDVNNYIGGAQTLLNIEGYSDSKRLAAHVENDPRTAGHVNLAIAFAIRENRTSRESWRTPNETDKAYLLQLEAWGYHLAPVERIAAGYPEPDTAEVA
ncbi:ParB N-terminal domain-containing protein [Agromyces sp. Soil535]|uniref:ParB/RepB/Spo0J family partition protein n=1 Tax=Agromyces sp. Soil535 TaxID=1736390 RepID=UPI0006FB9205|nr:ParB N-terminal domain-containing protein [Agromyces sp. Soil535]KRE28261.1 hypothetical protein ASG80_21525 [Agromyces sp. Soil535]